MDQLIKNLRLSNSLFKSYEQCPFLFFCRHILKIYLDEISIHLVFGKAIHKALELYKTNGTDMKETFKQEFTLDKIDKDETSKFIEYRQKGQLMLDYYAENEQSYLEEHNLDIVKTEEKLLFKDIDDPKTKLKLKFCELTGIIDFETKDGSLGDYKTSSKKYTQEQVDTELQPTIYYLLYYLEHGKLPERFIYVVFLKKRKRDMIQILETTRTFDDITKMIEQANELYSKVEQRLFDRVHDDDYRCDCYKYLEILKI